MSRKWVSLVVAGALLMAITGSAVAAPTVPGAVYSDTQAAGTSKPVEQVQKDLQNAGVTDVKPTDYFAGAMTVVIQAGLIKPDANGQIKPDAPLKADEGIAVFAKVLGIASKTDDAATAVAKAQQAGLVDNKVEATSDLSRLETARLLAKALGVQPKILDVNHFKDIAGLSPEDAGILNALYEMGVFKGFPDGSFQPNSVLTKAQIAILIDRILGASSSLSS